MAYRNIVDSAELTPEIAKKIFEYNAETGELFRHLIKGIKRTGCRSTKHNVVNYGGRQYQTTFIIWLIMHNRPPKGIIEHADTDGFNDKFNNLREGTQSQNMANINVTKRSKSGVKGVVWDVERKKWAVYIGHNYKSILVGRFDSIKEAKAAYDAKAVTLFGEFARP